MKQLIYSIFFLLLVSSCHINKCDDATGDIITYKNSTVHNITLVKYTRAKADTLKISPNSNISTSDNSHFYNDSAYIIYDLIKIKKYYYSNSSCTIPKSIHCKTSYASTDNKCNSSFLYEFIEQDYIDADTLR